MKELVSFKSKNIHPTLFILLKSSRKMFALLLIIIGLTSAGFGFKGKENVGKQDLPDLTVLNDRHSLFEMIFKVSIEYGR